MPLSLQEQLTAAHKTIGALVRRVEEGVASGESAFAVLEQNIALERVIAEKTREVVAQRRELEVALADLRKAQAELVQAQKLESVGRLAAGIAHEINTPIQFVSDNVYFLQEAFKDVMQLLPKYRQVCAARGACAPGLLAEIEDAEQAADLDDLLGAVPRSIERSIEGLGRVATLVRSMKEFAHPDEKQKVLADLNRALATTLTIARNEYKYVAEIETDYGELPPIPCHLGELNQVFLNVIVNAAHSIEAASGGVDKKGLIRVQTRLEGELVRISISDTGTGIPPEIRERIFDPFFTTKEVGKGTGQGLSIARSVVVDKHGGTLRFDTQTGCGTTFHIRLPVR